MFTCTMSAQPSVAPIHPSKPAPDQRALCAEWVYGFGTGISCREGWKYSNLYFVMVVRCQIAPLQRVHGQPAVDLTAASASRYCSG